MLNSNIIHSIKTRHGHVMLPWRTLILSLLASGLYLFFGSAPESLIYSREAIQQGEWWRLISGHWVHSDHQHALWDIAALLIIGAMTEHYLKQNLFPILIASSAIISAWLWFFMPEISHYCGLSGILHSLLVIGFYQLRQRHHVHEFFIIILLSIGKTIFELIHGAAIFTNTVWPALPESHLAGIIFAMIYLIIKRAINQVAGGTRRVMPDGNNTNITLRARCQNPDNSNNEKPRITPT